MRVIRLEDVPLTVRTDNAREGRFEFHRLLDGVPGAVGNFALRLSRTYGDFFSPRHRHNFDQIRFQLEGCFDFDRNGRMTPGTIAYFPEGTYYGPQSGSEDSLVLVLQFGGASGSGYMSEEEYNAGIVELKKRGEFRKGAYSYVGSDGRSHNKDGYEAVWEFVNRRALVYPAQRYNDPIFMHPENFVWIPEPGEPGVARKRLATLSERGTTIGFARLDAGAVMRADPASIYFAVSGRGRAGAQPWQARSTLYFAQGEGGEIAAGEPSELLQIGLPDLPGAACAASPPSDSPAESAAGHP